MRWSNKTFICMEPVGLWLAVMECVDTEINEERKEDQDSEAYSAIQNYLLINLTYFKQCFNSGRCHLTRGRYILHDKFEYNNRI